MRLLTYFMMLVAVFPWYVQAQEDLAEVINNGKSIYDDQNCARCHDGHRFSQAKGKAQTFPQVEGWVSSCGSFFKIDWFPEDMKSVAIYLNETYYKYPHTAEDYKMPE